MVAWMPWLSKHPSLPLGICHLPIRYRNPLQPPRLSSSWMWWCLTVLLPFQKRRQEIWELEANLDSVRSSASKTKAAATKKERSSPQFFQAFPPRHPHCKRTAALSPGENPLPGAQHQSVLKSESWWALSPLSTGSLYLLTWTACCFAPSLHCWILIYAVLFFLTYKFNPKRRYIAKPYRVGE